VSFMIQQIRCEDYIRSRVSYCRCFVIASIPTLFVSIFVPIGTLLGIDPMGKITDVVVFDVIMILTVGAEYRSVNVVELRVLVVTSSVMMMIASISSKTASVTSISASFSASSV
jgi:hypothetical protein